MENHGKPWSPELDEWLLQAIQQKDVLYCSQKLKRTEGSITRRLLKIATELYQKGKSIEDIHKIIKVSIEDIQYSIYKSNLKNYREPWDESQDNWLRKYILKLGKDECAKRMERTIKEIENRIDFLAMEDIQNGIIIENVCASYGLDIQSFTSNLNQLQDKVELNDLDKLKNPPYYVVLRGRSTGIYSTWEACKISVMGISSKYKKCNTIAEVKAYIAISASEHMFNNIPEESQQQQLLQLPPLSEDQEKVITDILARKNVLLLGSAGTGKTTLIHHIKHRCRIENISIGITGTTGTSSLLIHGKTLHSFLGIGLGRKNSKLLADILFYKYKNKVIELQELDILLIDEVSMLYAELFTRISDFLSIIRNDKRPFGGIQIVLCGDFYQLPPVEGEFVFRSEVWDKLQFITHILTKNYRQEDTTFQELLERAKIGKLIQTDMILLNKCKDTVFPEGIQPTRLFSSNSQVDIINNQAYASLQGYEKSYPTISLNKESKAYIKMIKIPEIITLKIGAQVMVTRNSATDNQIVNGTRGVVIKLFDDSVIIKTKFGDKKIIRCHDIITDNDLNISYKYIPLKFAWALTIHKAQGSTLDCVEVDLGYSIFTKGQAYAALSRVRSLDNLRILDIDEKSFQAHPDVVEFYKNIKI